MRSQAPLALLFDFDGLLFDTEQPELISAQRAAATVGASIDVERWKTVIGTAGEPDFWINWIAEQLGETGFDRAALRAYQREIKTELIASLEMQPGAEALLVAAHDAGIPCAVVSASPITWVLPFLERVEATHYFSDYVTRERVTRHKPDPEHYRDALRSMNIALTNAHRVVAFEDSVNGSRSSAGAGIHTVVVPHGLTEHGDFSHAHRRVGSLTEVSLADFNAL
jgi:HAD superfamily hydrolase (TIGR01509 family)